MPLEKSMSCPTQAKDWFDYLVVLVPPSIMVLIAAFVAWVAYQQWKTNKEKLRLDLYNRRFDIYAKTVSFYQALLDFDALNKAGIFSRLHKEFITAQRESQFLFDRSSGIFEILKDLHLATFKITGFKEHGEEFAGPGTQNEYQKMQKEMLNAYSQFEKSIEKLESKIARYLNFHKALA
jgi:hypothetical protein